MTLNTQNYNLSICHYIKMCWRPL